jgi:stage II sporulation protein AB (anti-sigma F factor)
MLDNFLKLEFPSLPQNVGLARLTVSTFASQLEFTLAEIEEIRVAISEAVSNCVIHAYPQKTGTISLELQIEQGTLMISVKDSGKGIEDVELAKQATFSTDPERMGLGLVFMESFMDEMEIKSRLEQGTTVVMKKRPERGLVNGISRIS